MSAALVILPMVWATAGDPTQRVEMAPEVVEQREMEQRTAPEVAFYRKYTEGLLRRYVRLSMEAGRAPSLLGREMFRGNVTNYSVQDFDDVVIFVHDVETCVKFNEEERRLVLAHGLTAEQIGFRRGLEASYRGLRSQEFAEDAESCFKATGECCFEVGAVESRLASVSEPIALRRGGALQIWLPPVPGKEYLVAVDTAGGGADGDFAAVQVIEIGSGLQCAELQQRLGTLELARVSAELAREYGGALIAVERNNHGAGVLAYLDSIERYARVYEQAGVAGWLTTAGSKPGMVSRMGALLVETPWMFFSRRLLGECRTFVAMAGGRTGAVNGAHDDCLMAMSIGQAVRAELMMRRR